MGVACPQGEVDFGPYLVVGWQRRGGKPKPKVSLLAKQRELVPTSHLFQAKQNSMLEPASGTIHTRACQFARKSFDVACMQCGHPHSPQQVPFPCVAPAPHLTSTRVWSDVFYCTSFIGTGFGRQRSGIRMSDDEIPSLAYSSASEDVEDSSGE